MARRKQGMMEMRKPGENRTPSSTASYHGNPHRSTKQERSDDMHSSLPSLNEGLQRISAVNQELDRKSSFAAGQVAPQSQEAFWMGCELCTQSRVREFALEEGILPRL